jgi:hypothetical protein
VHEWQLSDEIPPVKSTMTEELSDFVQKHGISFEWLLTGKLQYLRLMMLTRAPRGQLPFLTSAEGLKQACDALSPEQRQIVAREVDPALGGAEMKRRRRSVRKRNRQRIAAHARRRRR